MLIIHKCHQVTQKPVWKGFPVRFRVSLQKSKQNLDIIFKIGLNDEL